MSDEDDGDIESAIQKEVGHLKDKDTSKSDRVFTEVRINQECLLFMKCKAPVEPVEFCRRICQGVLSPGHSGVRARYLNRLTPMSVIVKATESGLEEGARQALSGHFKLKSKETGDTADSQADIESAKSKENVELEQKPATVSHSSHNSGHLC